MRRVRHETRFRRLSVRRVERLTPKMVRVALAGEELTGFTSLGFDDHVKVLFPSTGGSLQLPVAGTHGPEYPPGAPKPVMRDYTPRRYDAAAGELLIDFVVHSDGPATAWAASAAPGHPLGVGGPRGSIIIPTDLAWHLLIGDESALPAIGRRLEELPANTRAVAVIEVDNEAEQQSLESAAPFDVVWVHRGAEEAGSPEPLLKALREVTFPSGQYFAWAAAESQVARAVRQYLIAARNTDRHWIKAAGYWQRGAMGAHERIDD